jgi:FAD binding domain of DNA photolyase
MYESFLYILLFFVQDPDGAYTARWVPELSQLPRKWIHQPWKAPADVLASSGVILGETYPNRITMEDLQTLRLLNAQSIRSAREMAGKSFTDIGGYDIIAVPKVCRIAMEFLVGHL